MADILHELLRPKAASAYLLERWAIRQSEQSLARLRHFGTGPRFRKVGGRDIAYSRSALDEWARDRLSAKEYASTAEAAASAA